MCGLVNCRPRSNEWLHDHAAIRLNEAGN